MELSSTLNLLNRFVKYNLVDELEKSLELTDLEEIGLSLLEDSVSDESMLRSFISILNFIEYETDISTPVSDDTYDKVVAKFKDMSKESVIGTIENEASGSKKFGTHKYPELRGSLDKIHFLKTSDIPENDSRKSFEQYLTNVMKTISAQGIHIDKPIQIGVDFKWDGASHIFEMNGYSIDRVLTRYDVGNNIGVDITHIFKTCDLNRLLFTPLPKGIINLSEYGLKVETFMPTELFQRYVKDTEDSKCNRRSAIISIVNQNPEQFDPSLVRYLAMKPLQISSEQYMDVSDDPGWFYIGQLNGRHQYIHIYSTELQFEVPNLRSLVENMDMYPVKDSIDVVKILAGDMVPIDGTVFTILDIDIIRALGRSNDVNKFQIAFKFPQGQKKTILKNVEFTVGPTAGSITPLAIVEPVVINGNTITNATLSNFDKLERLDLNIGDEVIILYDIIPKLMKDKTCKKGNGAKVERLTHCPVCHSDLNGGTRCMNPECDAKLSGKIRNYIKKMRIKGIGQKTIEKFINKGFLTCIGDLYRLPIQKITNLPGFDIISCSNIMKNIMSRTKIYPHELLGSIGIPDVSLETMKKICRHMDIVHMSTFELEHSKPEMTSIHGIGEVKADKVINGILSKMEDIEDIITHVEFLEYPQNEPEPTEIVLFTGCRDYDFSDFLQDNNIKVVDDYVKSVTCLIVPDKMDISSTSNAKVKRAKASGTQIIHLSDAKTKFGYLS